ncbi:hypothetical protein [Orenia metallireducens]|nr:hypothetical protein [Orenia metallireducens]
MIIYMGIIATLLIGVMVLMPGHTDPILNSAGEVISESIATMEKIELGE